MKALAINREDLVKETDKLGHNFPTKLGATFGTQFEPYMEYCHVMEIIEPTAPAQIPDGTWISM